MLPGMYNRRSNSSDVTMKAKTTFYRKTRALAKAICIVIVLLTAVSCTINIYTNPTETVTVPAPGEVSTDEVQTELPPAVTTVEPSSVTENTTAEKKFVGSVKSNKYHLPSCEWAQKISPSNEIWFSSAEEAKAKGYVPCKVCNPR